LIFYQIADFLARLHVASCKNISSVSISFTKVNLRLLILFNLEGFIEGFRVLGDYILVFLRNSFLDMFLLFKNVSLVSTPGRRFFFNLRKLSKIYSYRNFSGCFILTCSKGFITSSDSLLKLHSTGEVFFKLFI